MNTQSVDRKDNMGKPYDLGESLSDSEDHVWVGMGEYGIVSSNGRYSKIETAGVGPCIALVLYDPKAKVAGLMHMLGQLHDIPWESETDLCGENIRKLHLDMMRNGIEESARREIEVHIIGGEEDDPTVTIVKQWIRNFGFSEPKTDLRYDGKRSFNFLFDATDGSLHTLMDVKKRDLGMLDGLAAITRHRIQYTTDPRSLHYPH